MTVVFSAYRQRGPPRPPLVSFHCSLSPLLDKKRVQMYAGLKNIYNVSKIKEKGGNFEREKGKSLPAQNIQISNGADGARKKGAKN